MTRTISDWSLAHESFVLTNKNNLKKNKINKISKKNERKFIPL
jgi:hypothetical protein